MNAPDRKTFIGGSDAAAVLGVSSWDTPLKLYLKKRGEYVPGEMDRKRERILARGKREEPYIVDDLIELYAIEVTKRSTPEAPNYHVHPEKSYIAAEIDFEWKVTVEAIERLRTRGVEIPEELIGTVQNGECKTAHPFVAAKKFGEEGTDEIPVEYFTQGMHGLMVSGRQVTLDAVAVYVDDPLLYLVRRDEEDIAKMFAREVAFMEQHVIPGVPPKPVNVPDVHLLLDRKREIRREATPEVFSLVRSLDVLRTRGAICEEGIEALKFEIGSFLLGANAVDEPKKGDDVNHVVTWQGAPILRVALESKMFVDAAKLRAEHPEVAAQCTKITSSFAYRKPRKGSK